MSELMGLLNEAAMRLGKEEAYASLDRCMEKAAAFGLSLTEEERKALVERRFSALKKYGRIEFGGGVIEEIILAFCDSAWICPDQFAETMAGLQDIFYYFKKEALEEFTDAELIRFMKTSFEGECKGDLDYLAQTSLEEVCRRVRYGESAGRILDEYEEEGEE